LIKTVSPPPYDKTNKDDHVKNSSKTRAIKTKLTVLRNWLRVTSKLTQSEPMMEDGTQLLWVPRFNIHSTSSNSHS